MLWSWGFWRLTWNIGFDVVYVEDISATTSPDYATQMVLYNAEGDGFVSNSTMILPALGGASSR